MADESAYIILTPSKVTLTADGLETVRVSVDSSDGTAQLSEMIPEGSEWISAEMINVFEDKEERIYLDVSAKDANTGGSAREGSRRVYNNSGVGVWLSVTQQGMENYVTLDPSSLEFSAAGGRSEMVTVISSDGTWAVDMDTVPDWLELEQAIGGDTFYLTAPENTDTEPRGVSVRVYNGQGAEAWLEVTQEGAEVISPKEWRVQYRGEFLDVRGDTWRAEILRNTSEECEAEELSFPADQPLTIEWPSTGFEDALWGSSATLRMISPGDRTYIGLYTVEPGTIRLDVYREGVIYWSGMLDTEFYEEPYEMLQGYDVELTFTDFGILDRLKYDLEGIQGVGDIVAHAVALTGISHLLEGESLPFDRSRVGISLAGGGDLFGGGEGLAVQSENFTDEEGEVSSWSEVLEGVLQPLGLKMVQRGGAVILFDLAGLRSAGGSSAVVWSGDSQTLGVDKVYNSVTVTFSPYAQTTLLEDSVTFDAEVSTDDVGSQSLSEDGAARGDLRWWTYTTPDDSTEYSFNLYLSAGGSGVTFGQDAPFSEYFHILPIWGSADECSGVPYLFYGGHDSMVGRQGWIPYHRWTEWGERNGKVFRTRRIHVPGQSGNYMLRLVMEILADCRYNPFADSDDNNYQSAQDVLEESSAFVFLSAYVNLYDSAEGGTAIWHLDNHNATNGGRTDLEYGMHTWVEGAASPGDFYFEWYDPDDLTDNSGAVGGWKANRHSVGRPDGGGNGRGSSGVEHVSARLRNAEDGEYVPLPPVGGWLEITVSDDLAGFAYGSEHDFEWGKYGDTWEDNGVRNDLRWFLMKCPEVHVVKGNLIFDDADLDDVEYRGTLDAAAQDDLSIDTICGTAAGAPPTALGLFLNADGSQVSELCRGGVTARPEELLIGQLYAQHAGRKTVLTGEAERPEDLLLTEGNQEGRMFVLTSDTFDARMATSEVEIRELGEDTYTSD